MRTQSFPITAFDRSVTADGITVYPAGKQERSLNADVYNFRNAYLLVFDKNGRLYEGGNNLSAGERSVQKTVKVPPGGFAIAFSNTHPIYRTYLEATENAVIYTSTISLIYPMFADYDTQTATLNIRIDEPEGETDTTVKYLFVGNSCTYINGNPIKFKALCKGAGKDVSVDYCTYGAAYFYEYADENHPRGQALRRILENKKYDYIVLQDGFDCNYDLRDSSLTKLLELVKQNGAKPYIYTRYGYDADHSKRIFANRKMESTFNDLAKAHGLTVCPVATAFLKCLDKHPEIQLYADDGNHHSKEGSYLAACCYLYTFCNVSPVGNSYTAGLDEKTASLLQNIAYSVCKKDAPTVKALPEVSEKNPVLKQSKEMRWAFVGAAAGVAAVIAAMVVVDIKSKKRKKSKK